MQMTTGVVPARPRYTEGRCRRCGAAELHRSRQRSRLERAIGFVLPLEPMRCPACGHRRLRLSSAARPLIVEEPAVAQNRHQRSEARRRRKQIEIAAWVGAAGLVAAALAYLAR